MSDMLTYAEIVLGCYNPNSVPTWQDPAKLSHAYLVDVNGVPNINLQGTLDISEWINRNLDAIGLESFEHPDFGPIHDGFARGAFGIAPLIENWLRQTGTIEYTLSSHSKGAGEGQIVAAELKRLGFPPAAVYLFEPPRAGTSILKAYLSNIDIFGTQTYNADGADLVTEVPTWPWVDVTELERLQVPDNYDIATKHKIPAVIEALKARELKPAA